MLTLPANPWDWPELTPAEISELSSLESGGPTAPLFQYFAVRKCNALKSDVQANGPQSGFSVLEAVSICAMHGLTQPDWLARAFLERYRAVLHFKAISWDSPLSFGKPYPKGTNMSARKKAHALRFAVYNAVQNTIAWEPDTPIDKGLFEQVGKPLGLGATLAEEYYYHTKRLWNASPTDPQAGAALSPFDPQAWALLAPYVSRVAPNPAKSKKSAGRRKPRS